MTQPLKPDPRLKDYATKRQWELIEAVIRHGSATAAAEAMGADLGNVCRAVRIVEQRAARQGFAPNHFEQGVAPGYQMGKVTVQRNASGDVERTWERQSPEAAHLRETMEAHALGVRDDIEPAPPTPPPETYDEDLLTVYPIGDPHCGLYAWEAETGNHFDLREFERIQCAAFDRIVEASPASAVALYNGKGDETHADNSKNRTPRSGHELDVHGRHGEVVRMAVRVKRYQIGRLLTKHKRVLVRIDPGNHDVETALHLALVLEALYENEPRVEIITSPNPYWYYAWGKVLIGTCHGDGAKGKDLPLLMATDVRDLWGAAAYCVWFVGHLHHKWIQEYNGCDVEYVATLAARDRHAHGAGYRSRRTLQAITYHRIDAEVERQTFSLQRIERLTALAMLDAA